MSIHCDTCPGKYTKQNKARHFKTKTHQLYVKPEECAICYEPFGWRPDRIFYHKSGKCFSEYAEECKHYICEDCETGLIRGKCPCEDCWDEIKCPLCREDWSDYLMNKSEWLIDAEYEDGRLVCLKKSVWSEEGEEERFFRENVEVRLRELTDGLMGEALRLNAQREIERDTEQIRAEQIRLRERLDDRLRLLVMSLGQSA